MKKIVVSPGNRARKELFSWWSSEDRDLRSNTSAMAASPGNMYQKQALKKRQTTSYLQPSSGSLSKADKYRKAERDIPLNVLHPPSPTINRSANMRKFSQITLSSDSSDDLHKDANSNNATKIKTPKPARPKLHQVSMTFVAHATRLSNVLCEVY